MTLCKSSILFGPVLHRRPGECPENVGSKERDEIRPRPRPPPSTPFNICLSQSVGRVITYAFKARAIPIRKETSNNEPKNLTATAPNRIGL